MTKQVMYKGYNFLIEYTCTYTQIYPHIEVIHSAKIITVNGYNIDNPTNHIWKTSICQPKSIISEIYVMINNYLDTNYNKTQTPLEEFECWNGDLDNWDE